jgi:hypothetical protein
VCADIDQKEVFVVQQRRWIRIPPSPSEEQVHNLIIEASSDHPRGVSNGDSKVTHVLRHYGACTDDGPIPDSDARQYQRAMADPDVVSDFHRMAPGQGLQPSVKEPPIVVGGDRIETVTDSIDSDMGPKLAVPADRNLSAV